MPGSGAWYSAVFSDLHFGDSRCTLHSMNTARALAQQLEACSPVKEIIFLGDVLDLQLSNWAQAVEGKFLDGPKKRAVGFRFFLNFLLERTGAASVVYLPGNHDYRVFDYHAIERSLIRPLRNGKRLSGKVSFFRTFHDSFLSGLITVPGVRMRVVYPHYSMKVNGHRVILTHGHFFDSSQAFLQEIGKAMRPASGLPASQIRKLRHAYFTRVSSYQNMVSGLAIRKEFRNAFSSIYEPIASLQTALRGQTAASPGILRAIRRYVALCCREKNVAAVVFGHTHKPGQAVDGGLRVWNAGTFLRETSRSPRGSYITIRHDGCSELDSAVRLCMLGNSAV